jgi:hypothetical protein
MNKIALGMVSTGGKASYLLNVNANAKTKKNKILTGVLYLSPSDSSGLANLCTSASAGCRALCLGHEGRFRMEDSICKKRGTSSARLKRTQELLGNKMAFLDRLQGEINSMKKRAKKVAIRLNGTSDIGFTETIANKDNKKITFYDYTKHKVKYLSFISNKLPANYHLTFSGDETTGNIGQWFDDILNHAENTDKKASMALAFFPDDYKRILENGFIVTAQGRKIPVIDGDKTDYRPSDPRVCIVALKAKGRAKKSTIGGFVKAFVAGEIL